MPTPNTDLAHTDGFRNNCAFHCFAHTLFAFDKATIKQAEEAHPEAFARLYSEFKNYYGIQEHVDLNFILAFNKAITHPYEREVIWGPVLRNILISLYEQPMQEQLNYEIPAEQINLNNIKIGGFIENDSINLLANTFGATTTATAHNNSPYLAGNPQPTPPWTSQWAIDLHNINNAHWEFSYPNAADNQQHNQQYDIRSSAYEAMSAAADTVGVVEQNSAIKTIVHKFVATIMKALFQTAKNEAKTLAANLQKEEQNPTQSGVALLWQAAGNTSPVEKDEDKALAAIIKQQMEIEQDIQAKRPKP